MSKTHDLGETVAAHMAVAVFKCYDGNAPDTSDIVVCATQELADEVVAWLNANDPRGEDKETDERSWPFVEGWEWSSKYETRPRIAMAATIRKSFDDAIAEATH